LLHLEFERNLGLGDRLIRVGLSLLLALPVATGALTRGWALAAVVVSLFLFIEAGLGY